MVITSSPALQVEPELHDLERFAGIARDGDLFGIAAEALRQAAAHGFDAGIENAPHVVSRAHVLDFEVADLGVHHDLGRRRDAAVVQVDDVAVDREGVADVEPEIFIAGDGIGGAAADGGGGGLGARRRIGPKGREGGAGGSKELAAVHAIKVHQRISHCYAGGQRMGRPAIGGILWAGVQTLADACWNWTPGGVWKASRPA